MEAVAGVEGSAAVDDDNSPALISEVPVEAGSAC